MDSKEKEIIDQAAEIFNRYGIKSITMDELARQMGISKKRPCTNILRIKMIW